MRFSTLWRPLAAASLLLAFAAPASAQLLNETFTNTAFPPGGWATFTTGAGTSPWGRASVTVSGAPNGYARSGFEAVAAGSFDIDWLVTPNLAPSADASSLTFKNWQSFSTNYGDTFRILVSTTSQTDASTFTAVATWDEATACPGGTGAPPFSRPAASNCSLDLSAFVGQTLFVAFQHTNNDGDNMNVDDVAGLPLNVGPASFSVTPGGVNFGAAGACVGFGRTASVAVQNGGGGTINVTNATLSGDPAFAIGTPAPALPGTATFGNPFAIPLVFNPGAAATGPQNGTLTITYNIDGGASQTRTIPLSGAADAEGAGFVYRSDDAAATCGNGADAPGATFVDIATHTQVTTFDSPTMPGGGSGDDGFFALDLGALGFGSARLFGRDLTTLFLSTNGIVTADFGVSNFYGGLPVSGVTTIQVGAMDLSFGTAGEFGTDYDTPDPGQYPVGLYYGLSDVDGDGDQELVITWFHAYDFGSPVYTSTTGTPKYFTSQLVISKAERANEEDIYEMRFPDGTDAAGVPFRQNTAGTTASAIENDVVIGIGEPAGAEAAIFRSNTVGGTLYSSGTNSRGVTFQAETQATATGQAGWRMMGAPLRDFTVGRLARLNLVQSVVGQYQDFPSDNLFTSYDGTAYSAATNVTDVLAPGRGFFWYLFNIDCDPTVGPCTPTGQGTGAPATDGTSESYLLPMMLQATGAEPALTNGGVPVALSTAGNTFNMVANPFRDDIDVSTLGSWATGGTLASAVPQVWDPNVGSNGSYTAVTGSLSAWQGFFLQAGTATGLNVPTNVRNTTGTFLGRDGSLFSNAATATLAFELAGTTPEGAVTIDRAATLRVDEDATADWDLLDATKLAPLSAAYATVGFQGAGYDGAPAVKAQESRALDAASFSVPLVVDAVGTQGTLTLAWSGLDALPETWALELRDVVTGATVDLRAQASYSFEQAATAAREVSDALVATTTTAAQAKAGAAPRFELVVTTGRSTAGESTAITEFALAAPAPNPTSRASTIRYDVPAASRVSVVVYDLLGRRVAVLADGDAAPGRHEARLDAQALAPGVYVVRMQAGTFLATQRVTVVR